MKTNFQTFPSFSTNGAINVYLFIEYVYKKLKITSHKGLNPIKWRLMLL